MASIASTLEPDQFASELLRSCQCDQMAAGDHVRVLFETLSSDALLEFERKEAVVRGGDHVDRYCGPAREPARLLDGTMRSQYDAIPPAPGISTNVDSRG
jgi:hypothetical protein